MSAVSTEVLYTVRVKADGCPVWLTIYAEGVTMHVRPGRGRLVSHSELLRVADGSPPDRYGVVINGRLAQVFDEEGEANDRASDQRQLGANAIVIRIPRSVNS